MNKIQINICLTLLCAFLVGCSHSPSISVMCERDKKGNYLLKWEIYPETENIPVEIYMSDNDSVFHSSPTKIVSSDAYMAMISDTTKPLERKYFKVKVSGQYSGVISNRLFELDSVINFRDIGGYYTNDNRQVKWGRVFRSGTFKHMTHRDMSEFRQLNLKTILDLQAKDIEPEDIRDKEIRARYIRIPVANDGYKSISREIVDGRFLKGDAVIYSQDIYKDMVDNYTGEYAQLFDYLLEEGNYPLALNCSLGKDQSGLATYLLLRALDVSSEVAEEDYMRSNQGINRMKLVGGEVDSLSESMQEALTMLTQTDITILKYGISCMRKKSGSVDTYMTKELDLTPEKRKELRKILLY